MVKRIAMLMVEGQAVSRSTYAGLFSQIGTTFGAGGAAFAVAYHTFGAAVCEALYGAPAVSTGAALTTDATTGTDTQWNVAAVVNDALYIKNRRGQSRTIEIRFE